MLFLSEARQKGNNTLNTDICAVTIQHRVSMWLYGLTNRWTEGTGYTMSTAKGGIKMLLFYGPLYQYSTHYDQKYM